MSYASTVLDTLANKNRKCITALRAKAKARARARTKLAAPRPNEPDTGSGQIRYRQEGRA